MKFRLVIAAGIAASLVLLPALAEEASREARAVEYRQSVYKVIGHNMGPLVAMSRGDIDYDGEMFHRNAERIAWMATMIADAFELDTRNSGADTEARDRIWSDFTRFENYAADLEAAAERLVEVSRDGGLSDVRPVFGEMAQVCRTCHDRFRDN